MSLAQLARRMAAPSNNTDDAAPIRVPPHNLELEMALLGAILCSNEALEQVADVLAPHHFHDPLHGALFTLIADTITAGSIANPVTLRHRVDDWEPLGEITVAQYLGRLAANATTIAGARDYAKGIVDLANRRRLILFAEDLCNKAYSSGIDTASSRLCEDAEADLAELVEHDRAQSDVTAEMAAERAAKAIFAAHGRGTGLAGLSTGLVDLDRQIGGLVDTDLVIIGGRPNSGKTSLATNMATAAARAGISVGFFSQEMSAGQLATRVIGEFAGISSSFLRTGDVTQAQVHGVRDAAAEFGRLPIIIDESGGHSVGSLSARARRWKKRHHVGLIIVDYIQLMRGSQARRNGNRVEDVTEITMGLKALAKELECPVVALSQLNRSVESREDKRPMLSDLRESGSIEQDADVVLFVYREEYYLQRQEPDVAEAREHAEWRAKMAAAAGLGEIIVSKHRHAPIGTVRVAFDASVTKFYDLERRS